MLHVACYLLHVARYGRAPLLDPFGSAGGYRWAVGRRVRRGRGPFLRHGDCTQQKLSSRPASWCCRRVCANKPMTAHGDSLLPSRFKRVRSMVNGCLQSGHEGGECISAQSSTQSTLHHDNKPQKLQVRGVCRTRVRSLGSPQGKSVRTKNRGCMVCALHARF